MTDAAGPPRIGLFLPSGGIDMMGGRNARWHDLLAMTRRAEELGFDEVCFLDHLDDYWEGWSLLSALAAATTRIGLVSYVTCTSYRSPALVAKLAETVDEISGGRLTLGLGAGDSDGEHRRYGFSRETPVARFEEAAGIIRTLLRDGRIDHHGRFYQLAECEIRPRGPRAASGGIPLLIGSLGGPRMLRITVQHADSWTATLLHTGNTREGLRAAQARVDAACLAHGRDPATLARRAEVLVTLPGHAAGWTELPAITGTAQQIADSLRERIDAGVSTLTLWVEPNDITGIEGLARAVAMLKG